MGLLSALYGLGLSCKKSYCMNNRKRLPARVISIGNLTLGGTGKTPAVIAVAREAKSRGLNPCVLTRGYGGKTKDISFVSRGQGALLSPVEAGDESYLMAVTLKGIPVVKGAKRYEAGLFALENLYPAQSEVVLQYAPTGPLFILDDGFQHWRLHRDIDVVLIDATNPFGNEKLFPEGIMREPLISLERAHVIVITRADAAEKGAVASISGKIKKYNREAPIFTSSHKPTCLISASGDAGALDSLRGSKIYAFSGIANPSYFRSVLTAEGAFIAGFTTFRDHRVYKQKDIDDIKKAAAGMDIVTTEKDMVKLRELNLPENVYALRIEFAVENEFYDNLFISVKA